MASLFSLQGRTALVTGGTRGIGQAMAIALAEAGADVVLVQRDESNTATRDEIVNKIGRKALIHVAELSDRESVKKIIPALVEQGVKPDILLNCAGIQRRHPSEKFPDEDWDEVININLTSVFTLSREFGAYLLSRDASEFPTGRRGAVINVGSLLSYQGGITVPAYAASKGGVAQLTKALSNEWVSKGINVNAIAPGYIATDMNVALINDANRNTSIMARIPAGRWGRPEDFKGVVVFLASEASSYVSGEMITVDGGWMGRRTAAAGQSRALRRVVPASFETRQEQLKRSPPVLAAAILQGQTAQPTHLVAIVKAPSLGSSPLN
ncbi:hypothetical protein UA08_01075 [Talaromyces atroroseus]|uniref:2-dehydro-3-deoxy-D-gluconate 5-dehydrogenase n=1 Tax=Talaromyces atroroseus TaxID=1441469 RepID=A0A225BBC6_TALAT|nr:hypothetical protein UA08_01075 [Talaromyces atroroseus]OKL64726.1 hypothetical protein UA08_01075 [Talaromyces atroroseus]